MIGVNIIFLGGDIGVNICMIIFGSSMDLEHDFLIENDLPFIKSEKRHIIS